MINPIIPNNYQKIDFTLSRSAQPSMNGLVWLKENGVTDIINLRSMVVPDIDYNEKKFVEDLGMKYHNIPSISKAPTRENVGEFLDIIEGIKSAGKNAHIHCKSGSDRTGMYSYIYERLFCNKLPKEARFELIEHGWHFKLYPDLAEWAENFVKRIQLK